jgi:hypothetical protein
MRGEEIQMSSDPGKSRVQRSTPPPVPPPVIGYATPGRPQPAPPQDTSSSQKVFDTVIGPNVRLKDNLIQLVCVIVGGGIGAGVGYSRGGTGPMVIGIAAGLFGALILSGIVIGILRFFGAVKK